MKSRIALRHVTATSLLVTEEGVKSRSIYLFTLCEEKIISQQENARQTLIHSQSNNNQGLLIMLSFHAFHTILQVLEKITQYGGTLDPHAAWLLQRGLNTLGLRVRQQNKTGLAVAQLLENHPKVRRCRRSTTQVQKCLGIGSPFMLSESLSFKLRVIGQPRIEYSVQQSAFGTCLDYCNTC